MNLNELNCNELNCMEQKENTGDVWKKVLAIRNGNRFKSLEILSGIVDSVFELHGDRYFGDDKAIVGGLADLKRTALTVIAQNKGINSKEQIERQYGMPLPEGYRVALRLMKQAVKFNRPIVCIIDTPGAYPGVEAEKRGQAESIARNLFEMSRLKVPVISVIIGEGGSGGALALGVANKIIMCENAIFSVVSPEGCASILWRDSKLAPKAAESLKLTANDLYKLEVVDEIISEENGVSEICSRLRQSMETYFEECKGKSVDTIQRERFDKFRNMGIKKSKGD